MPDEQYGLSRRALEVVQDTESEIDLGENTPIEVATTPKVEIPPPPPTPVFDIEEHSPKKPQDEQATVATRVGKKRGSPEVNRDRALKSAATMRARRATDPEMIELDRQNAEADSLLDDEKNSIGDLAGGGLETDSDLRAYLKKNRKKRYVALMQLATGAKSEAVRLRCLTLLEYRDLGRPGASAPPSSDDEPEGIIL